MYAYAIVAPSQERNAKLSVLEPFLKTCPEFDGICPLFNGISCPLLERLVNLLSLTTNLIMLILPSVNAGWRRPKGCLLYTSPSPRDGLLARMPSSA